MIGHCGVIVDSLQRTSSEIAKQYTRSMLQEGDVVVSIGPSFGKTLLVTDELSGANLTQGTARVAPANSVSANYLRWALRSAEAVTHWETAVGGATFRALNLAPLAMTPVPDVDLDEQRAIADYLDRETQLIDELIAEQRGLIETLRERRSAVIDRASLGEMDPLDSQVVGAWPVAAIGYGFNVKLGKMLDAGKKRDERASDLRYIRAGNIQDTGLDLSAVNEMPFTPEEASKFDLKSGDLLVVEGGAIGTCVVLDEDMPGWAFQKTVNRLRSAKGWSPRYYRYVLTAYRDRGVLDILSNKSTIAHFTAEKLRGLRVPVPPIDEQRRIAAYLDEQTSRIDNLIAESEDLIALSQERRAALITAAVTGQIDVRQVA